MDDKEFSGNIISLLFSTEKFVEQNSRQFWKVVGMRRENKSDYPMEAVREAIVNAIIHRDYFINGSEIHIDMYDDRLEITSPGGMKDGRQIQLLDINQVSSNRRNPVIADMFSRLGYAERRGSGLARIRSSFIDQEFVHFSSDDAVFIVTMFNQNYHVSDVLSDAVIAGNSYINMISEKQIGVTEQNILNLIKDNRSITMSEMAESAGISRRHVTRILTVLKENGILERIGNNRSGYWKLIDETK